MKLKLTIEVFSDTGRLLSKEALEIINISNQISLGAKSDIDVDNYQRINSSIERQLLQTKLNQLKPQCICGSKHYKRNGSTTRKLKTLNNDICLKVPKIYCKKCHKYTQMAKDKLPEDSNINQDLERLVLELVSLTTSYEALSELLFKLRGIRISPKEIERIVIQRRKQIIKDIQTQEYQRIDDVLKETKPKPIDKLYISADGTYVHSAECDSGSFEGKFGVVFTDTLSHLSKNRNFLLNKRYCSSFYGKEDFGELLNLTAYNMGLDNARETICICDGDKSLWKIRQEHFPNSKAILDWTHISRNLHKGMLSIEDEKKRKAKTNQLKSLLYHGNTEKALSLLSRLISKQQRDNQAAERLEYLAEFKGYIENNRDYIIDYEKARINGYFISSSVMESTVNTITANRLKKNRSRKWIRAGADGVSRVIVAIKNNEWDKVWNHIYTQDYSQN